MTNIFSSHSLDQILTCHNDLQEIAIRAIKEYDFSVLCGFRNNRDQNEAYDGGFSKLKWPRSMHNHFPSRAVDIAPYPTLYKDPVKFTELSIIIKRIAGELMIPITWGGDFAHFVDLPHWQLK